MRNWQTKFRLGNEAGPHRQSSAVARNNIEEREHNVGERPAAKLYHIVAAASFRGHHRLIIQGIKRFHKLSWYFLDSMPNNLYPRDVFFPFAMIIILIATRSKHRKTKQWELFNRIGTGSLKELSRLIGGEKKKRRLFFKSNDAQDRQIPQHNTRIYILTHDKR